MRRSLIWPLTLLLAVATGAAAAQTVNLASPPVADTDQSQATGAVVRAFYEAANAVIQAGDAAPLDTAVAPDFVDHAGLPGVSPDRAGLGRYLIALHGIAPGIRLSGDGVLADGNRAMARVAVNGTSRATFLGLALGGGVTVWGDADVFRVANRRVVERWGGAEATVAFDLLGRAPIGTGLPPKAGLALERLVLPPGEQIEGPAEESRLVEVEAGTVTVSVDADSVGSASLLSPGSDTAGDGARTLRPGSRATLATGDLVALSVSASYVLNNTGTRAAGLLVASFFPADDPRRAAPSSDPAILPQAGPWPPDLTPQALAGGSVTNVPPGTTTMGIGRMMLSPGAWLSSLMTPGPLLLLVESGTLDFALPTGTAWVRSGANGASTNRAAGSLQAGDGALLAPGATVSLRESGDAPAVVLIVAVTAAG